MKAIGILLILAGIAGFVLSGVAFVDIDLSIRYLRDENDRRPASDLYVLHFPYEDIYEEGLLERVKQANAGAIAYYAELDK
jgi:hypothetical protein